MTSVVADLSISYNVLAQVTSEPLQLNWNVGQAVPGIIALQNPGWISMQGGS
jgi:hypothetical protein